MRQVVNDIKTTWTFVDTQVCRQHNWTLISLHSELEQNFLGQLLQDKFDAYIDGIVYVYIGKRHLHVLIVLIDKLVDHKTATRCPEFFGQARKKHI